MGLPTIVHDQGEIDITMHFKYGNRKPKLLRPHFAIKRETKKLIVGHFGDHVENYMTHKRSQSRFLLKRKDEGKLRGRWSNL